MREITLSRGQVEDSIGSLNHAADKTFSRSDKDSGLYQPDKAKVPRPNFSLFEANAEANGIHRKSGYYEVDPANASVFIGFEGLKGIARVAVITKSRSVETMTGPAIVTGGGRNIVVLTAEQQAGRITPTQHALLESEYVKQLSEASPYHKTKDITNAGETAPALVVATSADYVGVHGVVHDLAKGNFGTNFSKYGRQDIRVGHEVRHVRSTVVPADNAILYMSRQDQLPADERLFDIELSASEMAVGIALAATRTRLGRMPNLEANLSSMVE